MGGHLQDPLPFKDNVAGILVVRVEDVVSLLTMFIVIIRVLYPTTIIAAVLN